MVGSVLEFSQAVEECFPVVKALMTDIPLGEAEPVAGTVSLDEARREFEAWGRAGEGRNQEPGGY